MTSIAGLISQKMQAQQDVARRMSVDLLSPLPRGNDDRNAFAQGVCALASWARRTVDLTPDGAQPFTADAFTVVLDGHIANASVLRREIEETGKTAFRGHSDAELIVQGAQIWGLNRLLQKLEGAFTFALWDANNAALHLVRDRLGARPLYVTTADDIIAFASDMRAFRLLPGFTPVIDPESAALYLAYGHIPAPRSLWDGVISLPPGHRLMIRGGDKTIPAPEKYWSAATTIEESVLRGHSDSGRMERLIAALSTDALRIDIPFALIDDFTPPASQLRSNLDRVSDQPYKSFPLNLPDGAALQTAYDALSFLSEPVSDPMAASWYIACKNAANDSGIVLAPSGLDIAPPEDEKDRNRRKLLSLTPAFLHPLIPARFARLAANAEDLYRSRARLWSLPVPETTIIEPRIDAGTSQRVAFHEFSDHFCQGVMPALDRIAHAAGVELRMPMADARLLDFGLPCVTGAGNPDIATWMRGPLRPRIDSQMNAAALARLGLEDPKPYLEAWKAFLGGDNAMTRPLWTLATLLSWAARN